MLELLDKIDIFDDQPIVGKQVVDPSGLVSWKIVEEIINTGKLPIELIESSGGKIDIPNRNYFWHSNRIQDKKFIFDLIREGLGFVILEYSRYNKEINDLCKLIEEYFPVLCDVHIYGGLSNAPSFGPHVDMPPNFIVQVEGTTTWRVFKNVASDLCSHEELNDPTIQPQFDLEFEQVLEPGDVIYIPSRRYHQALPSNKRLSVSIPCRNKKYEPDFALNRNYYTLDKG